MILDLFVLGNRAKDSSKDDLASLLISTHLTDLYKRPTKQTKGQRSWSDEAEESCDCSLLISLSDLSVA